MVRPLRRPVAWGMTTSAYRDLISPRGHQHQPDESITAALSEATHWSFGGLTGAAYGMLASGRGAQPLTGALYGAGLWAVMDEGAVPLLGLQDGPRATNLRQHATRLGAHVTYGLALRLTVWLLDQALPE